MGFFDIFRKKKTMTLEEVVKEMKKEGYSDKEIKERLTKKAVGQVFEGLGYSEERIEELKQGVTNDEASALSDRLRLELFKTMSFTVVERAMMEQILKEQGFQQSGCTTNECIVEVGRLIGVEQIAGGSISKIGSTYSVSARLVSVETGKILKTATYDFRGEIDDLLVSGMRQIAVKLAR